MLFECDRLSASDNCSFEFAASASLAMAAMRAARTAAKTSRFAPVCP
jgi:hypothetical protein